MMLLIRLFDDITDCHEQRGCGMIGVDFTVVIVNL